MNTAAPPPIPQRTEPSAADQAARLRALVESLGRRDRARSAPGGPEGEAAASPRAAVAGAGGTAGAGGAAGPVREADRGLARVVTIASGKGGVGKTNTAVNLCAALGLRGHRVVLLDADLGLANADVLCGLTPVRRLEEALPADRTTPRTLRELLLDAPGGFRLVPGSSGVARMADLPPPERRRLLHGLADLRRDADVVVIDAAAGLATGVTAFMQAADLSLVVTTPEPTAIADAYALVKCVAGPPDGGASGGGAAAALVVNQAKDAGEAGAVHARMDAVCRRFLGRELPLAGWIAHDPLVAQSVRARRPFVLAHPAGAATRGVEALAATLSTRFALPGHAAAVEPTAEPGWVKRMFGWARRE